jgi:uncharacterized protein YggE
MLNFYNELSERQKETVKRFGVLFVILLNIGLFSFIFFYGASAFRLWRPFEPVKTQLSFSGEGKIAAKPDIAKISFAILTEGPSLADAQKDNTSRSNKVTEFLKSNGVSDKDVKTVSYNIYPQYSYPGPCPLGIGLPCRPNESPKIIGYQIRHSLEVKVRDLDKAGTVLEGIVSAGANEISNFQFAIDDEEKLKEEARALAIKEAKNKAKVLAKELGVRLGRIVAFSESGSPIPIFYGKTEAAGLGGGVSAPQVQPGENEITVDVTITYELK